MIKATKLNSNGGIDFSNKGRRTFLKGVDGLVQRHDNRLRVFRGEWFRDESLGIPYIQSILGTKNPSLSVMRTVIGSELAQVPETLSISELLFDLDSQRRNLKISYKAKSEYGEIPTTIEVSI